MKKVTKYCLVFLLFTFQIQAQAQTFGIRGGVNLSTIKYKTDQFSGENENTKPLAGFHLGATVDFPLNEAFSIESGLTLNTKGSKSEPEDMYVAGGLFDPNNPNAEPQLISSASKVRLYYFDIPILLKFSHSIKQTNKKIYAALGPYLGFGFYGKSKGYTDILGVRNDFNNTIKWGSGSDKAYKIFDGGMTLGAGLEIDAIQLGVYYDYGLLNTASVSERELEDIFTYKYSTKNRVVRFSVGYRFGELFE